MNTLNVPVDVLDLVSGKPIGRVPALAEIVRLLSLQAGDPATVDKAIVYDQIAVTAAAIADIPRIAAGTEVWSVLYIKFSTPSGTGRYLIDGGNPTAAGFGIPILAGGEQIIIRGVDNINNFKMIAETGQTMEANVVLFKAPAWREIAR
jgi:hypothetical protein